jgi:hypothetical protein
MKHYLHGRVQVPEETLSAPTPPADRLQVVPFETASTSPNIEVVKQGEKVSRLIVTCTCGERIEIECLYPASG